MRTFIGELIFRFKDDASGKAKASAKMIGGSIEQIERAARRLNGAPWGARLQTDLEKLGASSRDLDKLRTSWERLNASMNARSLSRGARSQEIAAWSLAVKGHFAVLAQQAGEAERRTRGLVGSIRELAKLGAYSLTGGSLIYGGGYAVRGGTRASGSWEREKFRQQMASIPEAERERLISESERLGSKYPSVGVTEIAELARKARSMMGDIDKGMAILPDLVRGLVTLQSAKGDAAVSELSDLLRGVDNSGKNGGALGVQNTREIIAGMVRAAQVEGDDLDTGKLFQFARRGKIAVPGLSTEFLATAAPAFFQDVTAEGFGTAPSSAYQAFVIGSNAVASKQNIQAQRAMGLRTGEGKGELVDASLFGQNPYAWVKKNLVPALQKSGVDLADETSVAQAVASLSRNTNATGLLTRMVTQQEQVDRLLRQYGEAMGPEAADQARFKDPFVGWAGMVESFKNLAAAVGEDTMPTIVAGLNSLSSGINTLQQAWRDGDPLAKAGIAAGSAGALFGAWKAGGAVFGLITAGTNLNAAAVALQAAAVSLGGAGAVGNVGAAAAGASGGTLGSLMSSPALWAVAAAAAGVIGVGLVGRDSTKESKKPAYRDYSEQYSREENAARNYKQWNGFAFEGGMHRAWIGAGPMPGVEEAKRAGEEIEAALNVKGRPDLDLSSIDRGIAKAREFAAVMQRALVLAGQASGAAAAAENELRRSFSDYGVAP